MNIFYGAQESSSLVGIPIGITSPVLGLKICVIIVELKMVSQ